LLVIADFNAKAKAKRQIAQGAAIKCILGEQGKLQRNHLPWSVKAPTSARLTEDIDEQSQN
jgi:hypothetical protein